QLRLQASGSFEPQVLTADGVRLDTRTRTVSAKGDNIELTTREFSLLEMFMEHPGAVLSRQQILSRVWGLDFDPGTNIVDVYVGYLRNKLGSDTIKTVRGVGYCFGGEPQEHPNM